MDWMDEVREREKRKNQILFGKDSQYLAPLQQQIAEQNHRVVVLWALEYAEQTAQVLHLRYPDETRPMDAVNMAWEWAAGKIKMRQARRAILDAHAAAKEWDSPEDIALCHAVGQACGTVHATGHAIGFPIYELTAIIRRYGIEDCRLTVEERMQQYGERLQYWQGNYENVPMEWAEFMLK